MSCACLYPPAAERHRPLANRPTHFPSRYDKIYLRALKSWRYGQLRQKRKNKEKLKTKTEELRRNGPVKVREGSPMRAGGWVGVSGWLHTKTIYPRTVTHPSTNRARRRVTSLICPTSLSLGQTAEHHGRYRFTGTAAATDHTSPMHDHTPHYYHLHMHIMIDCLLRIIRGRFRAKPANPFLSGTWWAP